MVGNIGQRWKTRRNGGGEASPRKINISIGKVQESRPFIYLRALFHFFLFSYPFSSSANLTKTVLLLLLERESLFNRPDWKKRRRGKTRGKTETGIFIRKFDLTLAGQFGSSGEISNKFNEYSCFIRNDNGIFYRVRLVRKIPTGTIAQTNY